MNGQPDTKQPDRCLGPRRGTRGLTLVEMLVVVVVIGVLVALLLPAVQAAREAARRLACSNNLTQLIMALHNYEAAHQVYPSGTVNPTGPVLNQLTGYKHGWIEPLTPYLETEAVYHHIDRRVGVYHQNNTPVRSIRLPWLNCASSSQPNTVYSNYAGVHHDVEAPIDVDQHGVFFLNSAVGQDDVSDGLSYTFFLGEKLVELNDLGWMSGTNATLRNTGETLNESTRQIRKARAWNAIPALPPGVMRSTEEDDLDGMYFGEDETENSMAKSTSPRAAPTFVGGFGSFHPGSANFAMGDGSIRLVADTISMTIYRQLGHRADGQLVELTEGH